MEQSRSTQQIDRDWDHVASLAADLHDAHARFVDFVVGVLADGSWQAAGLRSPEHWLMLRAGLSRGQAGAMVLLARRAAARDRPRRCGRDGSAWTRPRSWPGTPRPRSTPRSRSSPSTRR